MAVFLKLQYMIIIGLAMLNIASNCFNHFINVLIKD